MLVVTDNDPGLAERTAREFGLEVYGLRRQIGFDSISLPMEEALSRALASSKSPVVVADQSDNAGGGAPGDATFALRWLLDHDAKDIGMAILYDPDVVRIAKKAGIGAKAAVQLGGKMGAFSGSPVDLEATVLAVHDQYVQVFPQRSGDPELIPTGDIVALRCRGIDLIVSSERNQCFNPLIFSDCGIDPTKKRLLVVKSTQHFYCTFAPMAGEVLYMAAPGALSPDPRRIPYRHLKTGGLYPWIEDPLSQH
jgi:microcystin degradation protein MlrC